MPDRKDKKEAIDWSAVPDEAHSNSNAIDWSAVPDETTPQKKSPVESGNTSAASSSEQQNGATTGNTQQPFAYTGPEDVPAVQPASVTTYSTVTPTAPKAIAAPIANTRQAVENIATDYIKNNPGVQPLTPGDNTHPLNQLTDPNGDPKVTGDYVQSRVQQLQKQYGLKSNPEIENLKASADHIISLQLANREFNSEKVKGEDAPAKIDELNQQEQDALNVADPAEKANIQTKYALLKRQVVQDQKFDATQLGLQKAALTGDKVAQADLAQYNQGLAINPDRKVGYQSQGLDIMQKGAVDAQQMQDEGKAAELNAHSDNAEQRLEKDNPKYFRKQWGNQVGSYIYNNVDNPLYGTIFTRPQLTPEEIQQYGKQAGLKQYQIDQLRPEDVPTSSSIYGQAAQAAFNAFTLKNENDPGGKLFTGDIPIEQKQPNNWRGVVGEIASGAGTVGGFVAQSALLGGALEGTEALGALAKNAKTYEHVTNLVPLAAANYNSSYHAAKDIIGDEPGDEGKRQLYAITNATLSTALMSLSPATKLGKDVLGGEAGKDFVKLLNKTDLSDITPQAYKDALSKSIVNISEETSKHVASQATIMGANQIADNLTKKVFDPEHRTGIMDNVGQAALSGGISMFIPSLLAGVNAGKGRSPMNSDIAFEVGTDPEKYTAQVNQLLQEGKITPDQAQQSHDAILTMKNVIATTPTENSEGQKMTINQVKDYAYNRMQENALQKKIEGITQQSEGNNIPVDEAQIAPLKKKIGDLQKEQGEILKNAGQIPPEDSKIVVPNQERSVATEPQSEENAPATKKVPEKLGQTEEKNIPLTPTEEETQKTTENGKQNDEGNRKQDQRENSANAVEHGQENPDAAQAANSEGRTNLEENRVLSSEDRNKPQATPAEQPLPVSRKRKKPIFDEEPIPVMVTPELQTRDDGTAKGKPESETEDKLHEAMLTAPEKPVDHLLTDKATGESPDHFVGRISDAMQDYTKPEDKGGLQDNTLLVTHSNVIKLLNAAYDKTAKQFDFNKPDLLEKVADQSTEVGNLYDFKIKDEAGNEKTLQVARHGETDSNKEDLQRKDDDKLTDAGREDAVDVARQLKEKGITPPQILSSDLPRAKETADIIRKELLKGKTNQGTEPSTERRNEVPSEKQVPVTKKETKTKKNATPQSKQPQQKGGTESGRLEHARVNPPREQAEKPEAKGSNKPERSQRQQKEAVKPLRNQSKKGWILSEYLKRKAAATKEEPQSIEEYVLHAMVHMNDKEPENKWALSSVVKDIPGGAKEEIKNGKPTGNLIPNNAEEGAIVKQFASNHAKATPIDVWAHDLAESAGEQHGNLPFHVPDEGEIRNIILDNISRFGSKTELVEHLEDIQKQRKAKEEQAMQGRQVPAETNDNDLAEMYSGKNGEDFEGYNDEGHPVFKKTEQQYDAVNKAELSDEDAKKIVEYYAKHYDEKTGQINYDAAHMDYNGMNELKSNLSKEGKALIDDIVPFDNFEQHSKTVQKLIEDAKRYETEKRAATAAEPEGTTAEPNTSREGDIEGRGTPREPESRTPEATEGKPTGEQLNQAPDEGKKLYRGQGGEMSKIQMGKYGDNVLYLTDNKTYANAFTLEEKGDGYARSEGATLTEHHLPSDTKIAEYSHAEYMKKASEFIGKKANELTTEDLNKFNDNLRKNYDAIKINRIESVVPTEGKAGIVERGKEVSEYLILNKDILKEKTNQAPEEERSVATNAQPEKELSATEKRLAEIEDNLKKQLASQKLEHQLREKAEKEKNIPEANKHNENWYKKQEKINKLNEEKAALLRDQQIKQSYNDFADKLEAKYERNKKQHEGVANATFLGLSTKIADHVADFLAARTFEAIRELGNVHVAIRRAIRLTKEQFGEEAKGLTFKDEADIRKYFGELDKHPDSEPSLPIDQEEYAKDILADILDGKMTYEDAEKEVSDEVIENRAGQPASDHIQEKNKAKILNYIKWHVADDTTSIKNETTRLRRQHYGLDEEVPAAKKEFGETWKEATDKIEKGYDPQNLIQELADHPRPVTDVENAILLHQQNTKEIKLMDLNKKINEAAEQGDQAAVSEYKTAKAATLDELQQLYDVNKAIGTENARGLASRRMMVDRKYSLVNMLAEKRATANDGEPLSEEQQAQVEKLHQKIKETQDAFDNYVKEQESRIIDLQDQVLSQKVKDKKSASQKLFAFADKIEAASKNQAYSSPIPITPKMVAEAIRIVATGVEKGEQLVDLVKKAVTGISKDNPGIDEQQLKKEINKNIIDAGILDPTTQSKTVKDMSGFFANGRLDREAIRLKVEADRAKAEADVQIKRDEQKKLSTLAKARNLFIKWQRAFKLSNPITLGKLTNAALSRMFITTPAEDIVGGAFSKAIPKLAKGAIGEGGGLNVGETARAYKTGFIKGIQDAKEIMSKGSHGKSELDVLYGRGGDLPPEAIDFFGQLHSAIKAPAKRFMFERSIERRLRNTMAAGGDITDPMVQTFIMTGAYKDANRAIFMQDNAISEWWQNSIRSIEKGSPAKGKPGHPAAAAVMQWMVPFVKVPTNIVAETARSIYGLPVGAGQVLHAAFNKGIEKIPDDQKDIVLRNLKKGTLGAAALALGYFLPQTFGGYYQPGQKRDEEDAPAGGLKIGDEKIPAWFVESPIFQVMQFGATIRRVKDQLLHGEEKGIGEGVWAASIGLVQNVPLAGQPVRLAKIFASPGERNYYFDELAKSTLIPAGVNYAAEVTDPTSGTMPARLVEPENKRKPTTLGEHIESGIPGLRENLQEK